MSVLMVGLLTAGENWPTSVARVVLVAALLILVEVDIVVRRLPREISCPSAIASFVLLSVGRHDRVPAMIVGAVLPTAFLALTLWCSRRQLGGGDVRLAPLLGVHLGSSSLSLVFFGFMTSFVIAGTVVVALVIMGRANRSTTLAFGPFLAVGTVIALAVAS